MSDETENNFTLNEAAAYFEERMGFKPSHASLYRWSVTGYGERPKVYLRHIRLGKRIITSQEACDEFVRELTERSKSEAESRRVASTKAKRAATVAQELESEGL